VLLTRRSFNFSSLTALGLALSGLSGCKPKRKDAFRIGLLSPRTGMDSQVGQACERGGRVAELLLKDALPSLEIIYNDTESSVDIGRNKAEMLISEGTHILIGAHNSSVTAAVAQVCEQRKTPLLVNIAAAKRITEQGYRYVFRNFPTTDVLAANGIKLMNDLFQLKDTPPKTAALLYINDTYGQSMYEAISYYFPRLNLPCRLIEIVSYDPRTQDLSGEIAKIKASKAELLIPITRLNDAIQMMREIVKQRYNPMGIISPGSPGMYEKQFFSILGAHSEYCITNTCWYNPNSPLAQKALAIFEKLYPKEQFDLNVAFTIEAILIAVDAYQRSQSFHGQDLGQAIRETNITERIVFGGSITFDKKGQALNIESVALQNRNGNPQIILPKKLQQIVPIFPFPAWQTS
jgi:branched-chain amino acid transport system substrate-binding protein